MKSLETTWIPCELHAHTIHGDGRLTVEEMAREARALGLEIVALTDHNTNSGIREIPEAERKSGVTIIPGMELTTFYGHMLAFGTTRYIEWRSLSRGNIHSAIDAIHASGGLVGVAHPFQPGNPFCSGCFWVFDGLDWNRADYLEVWSEANPWSRPKNSLAFRLWDELLDSGRRIAAVSAADFHAPDRDHLAAVTYLGVRGRNDQERDLIAGVKEPLRGGRAFVTLGPLLFIAVRGSGTDRDHGPGEAIPRNPDAAGLRVDGAWDSNDRRRFWEPQMEVLAVALRGNKGVLARRSVESGKGSQGFSLARQGHRWIRAELHGRVRGEEAMIAFSNPVYVEH